MQLSGEIVRIRLHVEVTMTAQIEKNGFRHTVALARNGLVDGRFNGMICFRGGNNPLCFGEPYPGLETLCREYAFLPAV